MKSKKNKTRKNKTRKKKIYGADKYDYYSIHKCTLISFEPLASCKQFMSMFGNKMSGIQTPPDPALAKRGIRWVRFLSGGKAEFHFVPPATLKDDKLLKRLVKQQKDIDPLKSQFFENHVGIYVPDLTDIIIKCLKMKIECHLNKRADGMYQFYCQINGCLDYLDVDSVVCDFNKIHKVDPDFRAYSFQENIDSVHKDEKHFIKSLKKRKSVKSHLYTDPKHNNAPRRITFHKNGTIKITGRDTPRGKNWTIKGKINKNKDAVLDFSPKGGPSKINAKITEKGVKFSDGNLWSSVYHL